MNKVTSALLFEMSNIYRDFLLKHGIDKIFFWVAFQFELAKDVSFFIRAISVRYSKLYPIRNWTDSDNTYLHNALFGKSEDWIYESEKRILIPNHANQYGNFNHLSLTGVLLGSKFTQYDWLKSLLTQRINRFGGDPLTIYKATQSDDAYRLFFNRDSTF